MIREQIEYQLVRSNRKTVVIYVKEDGSIQVRAPKWVPKAEIQKILGEKSEWIRNKQQEAADKNCVRQKYYTEGAVFLCMEKEYRLHITESKRNAVYVQEREESLLIVKTRNLEETYIKELLIKWSGEQLKRYVQEAVIRYLPAIGELAQTLAQTECKRQERFEEASGRMRITIKNVKTRWGSCSAKGHLNFSVKLAMAPVKTIDYVVVHELCHLLHRNHGSEFWSAVEAILPDYQKRRKYLKENGWRFEF